MVFTNSRGASTSFSNQDHDDDDDGPTLMNLPASLAQPPPVQRTQFYVEEASMYTITEDSRENRSEVTSIASTRAGTQASFSTPMSSSRQDPLNMSSPGSSRGPILTDWGLNDSGWAVQGYDEDDDNKPDEGPRWMPSSMVPPTMDTGSEDEQSSNPSDPPSEEDHFPLPVYGIVGQNRKLPMPMPEESPRKRRYPKYPILYTTLICIVLASIVVTISVPLMRQTKSSGASSSLGGLSSGNGGDDDDSDAQTNSITSSPTPTSAPTSMPTTSSPTMVPTKSPSLRPTLPPSFPPEVTSASQKHVYQSLAQCPATNLEELIDLSKAQSMAFWELDWELQNLVPDAGLYEILDRWGLRMLYFQSGGERWTEPDDWFVLMANDQMTPVCTWAGITCNDEGNITRIEMNGRGLKGPLPKELCCLSALEVLDVSDNISLRGTIPSCLFNLDVFNYSDTQLKVD